MGIDAFQIRRQICILSIVYCVTLCFLHLLTKMTLNKYSSIFPVYIYHTFLSETILVLKSWSSFSSLFS